MVEVWALIRSDVLNSDQKKKMSPETQGRKKKNKNQSWEKSVFLVPMGGNWYVVCRPCRARVIRKGADAGGAKQASNVYGCSQNSLEKEGECR
jgi:hypothetical protein